MVLAHDDDRSLKFVSPQPTMRDDTMVMMMMIPNTHTHEGVLSRYYVVYMLG